MKKLRVVISLVTAENDYQLDQASAAEQTANRLGVEVEVIFAEGDAITQSQQLLKIIQSDSCARPQVIMVEPAGATGLPQVARASASAGIAWVVLNHEANYITELRQAYPVPVFMVGSDHVEIGRIQGRQFAALLPGGGRILYIQGPSNSTVSQQRTTGMYDTKPDNVEVKLLRSATWSEEGGYKAVLAWLRLATSHDAKVDLVGAQNDFIALGARKAFEQHTAGREREVRLKVPFTGVDGVPRTGQAWVRRGLLRATVVVPANTAPALRMVVDNILNNSRSPESSLIPAASFPDFEALR